MEASPPLEEVARQQKPNGRHPIRLAPVARFYWDVWVWLRSPAPCFARP